MVERRRRFGDRLFRLWVEDCALRGGVRVHAMDVQSLCRSHVDLHDNDVQSMFNRFISRSCNRMERWIAGVSETSSAAHDRELQEFLCCLLDAAYFELDEAGSSLQLRLPAFVEPLAAVPAEEQTLVEVDRPQSPKSPISAHWIREKLLVPRSVASERAVGPTTQRSRSQCSVSRSSRGGGGRARSSDRQSPAAVYGAPPRRPRSARCSAGPPPAVYSVEEVVAPVQSSSSSSSCKPRRPSSSHRSALPSEYSVSSSCCREAVGAAAFRSGSRGSLHDVSRHCVSVDASTHINHNTSVAALSDCGDGREASPHRTKQRADTGFSRQQIPKRPASAHHRSVPAGAAGGGGAAVRACSAGGGLRSLLRKSQSSRSSRFSVEPKQEPVPIPPPQPRTRPGNGRPFPRAVNSVEVVEAREPSAEVTLSIQDTLGIAEEAADDATRTLGFVEDAGEEANDLEVHPRGHPRLLRPTSAKATKHKRVADNCEKPTVYEDFEESEPDVLDDENDCLEGEVEVRPAAVEMRRVEAPTTQSLCVVGCMSSLPPKPTRSEHVTPPKPLLEAWPRASPPRSGYSDPSVPGGCGSISFQQDDRGFRSDALDADQKPQQISFPPQHLLGSCMSHEPRASSPPPRRPCLAA